MKAKNFLIYVVSIGIGILFLITIPVILGLFFIYIRSKFNHISLLNPVELLINSYIFSTAISISLYEYWLKPVIRLLLERLEK